jgi:hypothetical protein
MTTKDYHDMIEEMAMTSHPAAIRAGSLGCGDRWGSRRGNKRGEAVDNRGRGGEMLQPEDTYSRHPNHIVAIASTHFIARMRALKTQVSQEEKSMINVKLHHRGINTP